MSFLALSSTITEKEYISDIPESNKQDGIQHFKFFELITAKGKKKQSEFRIVYLCKTKELAKKLVKADYAITILTPDLNINRVSICCFIINNKDINKINKNLLNDYTKLVGKEDSLFVSTLKKNIFDEDLEYLNTLDIEFKFLTDNYHYTWKSI